MRRLNDTRTEELLHLITSTPKVFSKFSLQQIGNIMWIYCISRFPVRAGHEETQNNVSLLPLNTFATPPLSSHSLSVVLLLPLAPLLLLPIPLWSPQRIYTQHSTRKSLWFPRRKEEGQLHNPGYVEKVSRSREGKLQSGWAVQIPLVRFLRNSLIRKEGKGNQWLLNNKLEQLEEWDTFNN